MFYQYHYAKHSTDNLLACLDSHGIEYKFCYDFVVFDLYSTTDGVEKILADLQEQFRCKPSCVFPVYSKEEIEQSPLLWVKPVKKSIEIGENKDTYEYSCIWTNIAGKSIAQHCHQPGTLMILKEPSPKTRTAIYSSVWWGCVEIFADKRVYELAQKHQLKGIEFAKVLRRNGEASDTFFQLRSKQIIGRDCIPPQPNERIIHCPVCGMEQYRIDSEYILHVDYSKLDLSYDLYETEHIFCDTDRTIPFYVMSQRFYQLLKKNKLAGSLNIAPVFDSHQPVGTPQGY